MWKLLVYNMLFYLSLWLSKLVNFVARVLNLGAGYTWPGHVGLSLFPNILSFHKMIFPMGVVLVSGTNGKTTTSKLNTHLLEESGYMVTHNRTGANLLNGIVSTILLDMNLFGKIRSDIGVFEVDENRLPRVLEYLSPNVLVLLNLSRDQLDRYGETDVVLNAWLEGIKNMSSDTEVVLDVTQDKFSSIPSVFRGEVTYFDSDTYFARNTSLIGSFNAKNVNAAVYTCMLLGLSEEVIVDSLKSFESAYGRGEIVEYKGCCLQFLLAKNPASFNNNLEAVLDGALDFDTVFIVLNDNIPDGRDVSWIYDVNQTLLKTTLNDKKIIVSGTRCLDMGIRLQYAGLDVSGDLTTPSLKLGLKKAIETPTNKSILVLPNYSSMLELRKLLLGRAIL